MGLIEVKNRLRQISWLRPVLRIMKNVRLRQRIWAFQRKDLPDSVIVELTNVCNLKCAKCPTYEASRGRGMMELATFQKLMADIASSRSRTSISLNGGGEAILHPQVVEFVRMARAVKNVESISLTTNSLALEPRLSEQLLAAGIDKLKLSLDFIDAATYAAVNRVDGYETVIRNIKELCRIKKTHGYPCKITLKVTRYKKDDELLHRIRVLWSEHVDYIKVTGLHNWAGLRGKRRTPSRTSACEYLWEEVQVLWDGQITLCCWDSMEGFYDMGNVRTVSLSRYWKHDPRLQQIRAAHRRLDFSQLELCATCNADTYITEHYFRGSSGNPVV